MDKKIAVVTGGNRGIGFEVVKELTQLGLNVILTSRVEKEGKKAVEELKKQNLHVDFFKLDVTSSNDIANLRRYIDQKYGRVDVLINNAGVLLDDPSNTSIFNANVKTFYETMDVNVYGPFQLIQSLAPIMRKHNYGRVVNVSSGMGQLSEMKGGYPAYRLSKTALNVLTKIFAEELNGTGVTVNSVCPGWVKTRMGGANATRPLEKGAETIVWLATLEGPAAPTGKFFRDKKEIEW